jgi:amino acid permease
MNLGRTKTIEQSISDTEEPTHQLRKRLGPIDLTVFGVGVVIGTGIFVLTGKAAGVQAGPAVASRLYGHSVLPLYAGTSTQPLHLVVGRGEYTD